MQNRPPSRPVSIYVFVAPGTNLHSENVSIIVTVSLSSLYDVVLDSSNCTIALTFALWKFVERCSLASKIRNDLDMYLIRTQMDSCFGIILWWVLSLSLSSAPAPSWLNSEILWISETDTCVTRRLLPSLAFATLWQHSVRLWTKRIKESSKSSRRNIHLCVVRTSNAITKFDAIAACPWRRWRASDGRIESVSTHTYEIRFIFEIFIIAMCVCVHMVLYKSLEKLIRTRIHYVQ